MVAALLPEGPGASAGGDEIDDGEREGDVGVRDGAAVGVNLEEDGDGVSEEAAGDAAGDCATAEKTNIAAKRIRIEMQERAIL